MNFAVLYVIGLLFLGTIAFILGMRHKEISKVINAIKKRKTVYHIADIKGDKIVVREDWFKLLKKNREKAEQWLKDHAEHCHSRNSYCLHKVFCPDCPFGLLSVQSGREILNI